MPFALVNDIVGVPAIQAELIPGNNAATGTAETAVGRDVDMSVALGQQVWTSDFRDVSTNPWHTVTLTINEGGGDNGLQLQIDGGAPLNYSGVTYTTIDNVQMIATARTSGVSIAWHNVTATFYQNGTVQETIATSDVVSDTTQSGNSSDHILCITPTNSTNTKVVLTASVRMTSVDASMHSLAAVVGQIFACAENVDGAQTTTLPDTLAVNTSNLYISQSGGSYGGPDTTPLQAFYIPDFGAYANCYVVIKSTNADIYIYWDSTISMWHSDIYTNGGLIWNGLGSADVHNPAGDYTTAPYTETGYGSLLVTVVS